MKFEDFSEYIGDLIGNDELDLAIKELSSFLKGTKALDELIIHSSNYNDIRRKLRIGVLSLEEETLSKNKIRFALLDLLNDIEGKIKSNRLIQSEVSSFLGSKNIQNNSFTNYGSGDIVVGDKITYQYFLEGYKKKIPNYLTSLPFIDDSKFIGRQNELKEILNELSLNNKVLLVAGVGGIGKTSLVKSFINRNSKKYKHLAWLDGTFGIKESFVLNTQLIDSLGISDDLNNLDHQLKIDKGFELIIGRLNSLHGKSILVIDNVDEFAERESVISRLRLNSNNWDVIITSRHELNGYEILTLGVLPKSDSIRLFYKYYKYENNDQIVFNILKQVNYHTLSVEVIAKVANENIIKLNELETELKKKDRLYSSLSGIKISHNDMLEIGPFAEYLLVMFQISTLSHRHIDAISKFLILPSVMISFRNNQEYNLANLLSLDTLKKRNSVSKLLNEISRMGWLSRNEYSFFLHPILKDVLGLYVKLEIEENIDILNVVKEWLKNEAGYDPVIQYKAVPFGLSIVEYFKNKLNKNISEISIYVQNLKMHFGDYSGAVIYGEIALKIDKALYSKNPSERFANNLGDSHNGLANIFRLKENQDKALFHYKESLSLFKKIHRETSEHYAIVLGNISIVYRQKGQLDLAYDFSKKALEINKKLLNENHPHLAISHNVVGAIAHSLEMYKESYDHFHKALRIREAILKNGHTSFIFSYTNLSVSLLCLNRLEEALEYGEKAVSLAKEIYSDNQIELGKCYDNLAKVYIKIGKLEAALEVALQANKIFLQKLNINHSSVAKSYKSLSRIYLNLGQKNKSLENIEKAIKIQKVIFSSDDTRLLSTIELYNEIKIA